MQSLVFPLCFFVCAWSSSFSLFFCGVIFYLLCLRLSCLGARLVVVGKPRDNAKSLQSLRHSRCGFPSSLSRSFVRNLNSILSCSRLHSTLWVSLCHVSAVGVIYTITKHGKENRTQNWVQFFLPCFYTSPLHTQSTSFAISTYNFWNFGACNIPLERYFEELSNSILLALRF